MLCLVVAYVKSVEMGHFNTTIHTASGALANSGIRHNLEEVPVQSAKQSKRLPANLRRISRPNTMTPQETQQEPETAREKQRNVESRKTISEGTKNTK
jgi:hypothetical protein